MNVYDFDKTVYNGDSSVDFYLFVAKRHPSVLLSIPAIMACAALRALGMMSTERLKERFFGFLPRIENVEREVSLFWDKNLGRVAPWYLARQKSDDIIISASPELLLTEAARRLGVRFLIATEIDVKSGRLLSPNCKGEEKLKRFRARFGDAEINEIYTDSLSDLPLIEHARQAYLVRHGAPTEFKKTEMKKRRGK